MNDLPNGWQLSMIGDLCNSVEKFDPANLGRDSFMYVDIGALEPSSSSLEHVVPISTIKAPGRARQLIREGDSLFATVRPYMRKVAHVSKEFDGEIASTGFCVLRPIETKLHPKFLFYFLLSDQLLDQVLPLQRGVSYPAIRDNDLKSALLPLPSLQEQLKIVEILEDHLSRLDAALADVRQAKVKAAQFRRSLFQAAFTGNLMGDGTRPMTDLPTGWRNERFGDMFKVKYGKAIEKSLRKDFAQFPVVGSAGVMTYTDTPLTSEPTIVIGRKGNVGSIQIFEDGCYPIDTTYYMQSNNEFEIKFLTYLLTSLELVNLDSSTATPSLRREDLENVSLVIPSLAEQHKIVEILEGHLSRLDASVAIADAMEKQSSSLRRSLLQAAFTGQLTKEVVSV